MSDPHDLSFDNRHRQGQADRKGRSFAQFRGDFDFSAEGLDVFLDHIHTHAPAGHFGHLGGGGKTGGEDELVNLPIAEFLIGTDHLHVHGLFQDLFLIQAASVVLDFDHDATGLMERPQQDMADGIFSGGGSIFRRFQTMIHGVADHMDQRIADLIDDNPIQFGFFAFGGEFDFFAGLLAQIANQTRHFLKHALDGNHPHHHGQFRQFPQQFARSGRKLDFQLRAAGMFLARAAQDSARCDKREAQARIKAKQRDFIGLKCALNGRSLPGFEMGGHGKFFQQVRRNCTVRKKSAPRLNLHRVCHPGNDARRRLHKHHTRNAGEIALTASRKTGRIQ
ncbi:hypothetical protein U14_02383 [Candidatus Moduliflexus flocculans]|uniref:Uncharacterized protein n=1 Tax=Candidatus Moduliflexus flocculans TaxID=1499966 RepID=A0A0S6VU95_9BACT|nr:hypothetical protein U14_02383 [Candidatus Moduliflexus flocculans]